jgi:hypothetical protein
VFLIPLVSLSLSDAPLSPCACAQLRSLVFRSCEAWTDYVRDTFLADAEATGGMVSVRNAGVPGLERREVWATPLFDVELVVVGTKVGFSPSVEEMHRYVHAHGIM